MQPMVAVRSKDSAARAAGAADRAVCHPVALALLASCCRGGSTGRLLTRIRRPHSPVIDAQRAVIVASGQIAVGIAMASIFAILSIFFTLRSLVEVICGGVRP